jgi:hypothetical protein
MRRHGAMTLLIFALEEPPRCSSEQKLRNVLDKLKVLTELRRNRNLDHRQQSVSKWNFVRLLSVQQYLGELLMKRPKVVSSQRIASQLFPNCNKVHTGRLFRQWAHYFVDNGESPVQIQGQFVKVKSLINDEYVQRINKIGFIMSNSQVGAVDQGKPSSGNGI